MKKIILLVLISVLFTGCMIGNTPTKKVEEFLTKYQTLDKDVLDDLNKTLDKDKSLDTKMKAEYLEFMKNHYQNLTYEIKDEMIDGNYAEVTTEITVKDYSSVVTNALAYRLDNEDEFMDADGNYNPTLFTTYRLEKLKEVKDMTTYTIVFTLTKQKDNWVLDQLTRDDLSKINGLYAN